MADGKLTIAGRPDDVHCADGEEAQLLQLAAVVDEKARGIQGGTEVRQLLFAALMLADDAQEAKGKVDKAEPQSDSLRAAVALAESREAATPVSYNHLTLPAREHAEASGGRGH